MKVKYKKRIKIAVLITAAILIILVGGFYVYSLDYYRTSDYVTQTPDKENIEKQGNMTVFYPDNETDTKTGLIFYPGGKVEASAYSPLLEKLSQNGITCILIKMPLNLAVFNINAANKVYDEFPDIESWYLSGHSLGGAMASSYVGKNSDKLDGLILLGAYPINDSEIDTLVIYGSEDEGLDLTKLEGTNNKLEIAGGNHAYFGDYGEQEGDGTATITRAEQQEITVDAISEFILGGS